MLQLYQRRQIARTWQCVLGCRSMVMFLLLTQLLTTCGSIADDSGTAVLADPAPVTQATLPTGDGTGPEVFGGRKDPMTELLHWAVEHSDPETLKEIMQKYKDENLTVQDVYGKDVLDALFVDESSVMRELISKIRDFRNESIPEDEVEGALEHLQEFIEQIDNAGNLHRMGGLSPLLELAEDVSSRTIETRALALWTLGIAVQNNEPVQKDLITLDGPSRLAALVSVCDQQISGSAQYCSKLLYALSGLVKNDAGIQATASKLGVFDWLFNSGIQHSSIAVVKKSLGLLDTVLAQSPELEFLDGLSARQATISSALLGHIGNTEANTGDVDLAEKGLRLVNRLLSLRPLLFSQGFKDDLARSSQVALHNCEVNSGADEEVCGGLSGLLTHANLMLAAQDVADDEL